MRLSVRTGTFSSRLLQLRVLGFGLLVDGDVGVGVFPEGGVRLPDVLSLMPSFGLHRNFTRKKRIRVRSDHYGQALSMVVSSCFVCMASCGARQRSSTNNKRLF